MTRNSRRVLVLTGLFGLSLLSCGREVTGPDNGLQFGRSRVAAFAIDPQFPALPGANLASDLVPFVTVRVTLRDVGGAIVKDTVVDFPSTADSVALTLDVPLPLTAPDSGLPLTLAMAFVNAAGDTVFRGGPSPITAKPSGTPGASQPIELPISWVPPGAVPASVVLTPTTGTVVAGTTTVFSATAFDAGGAPIPGTPIDFSADTASRASFAAPGSGTVTWLPNRGNVRIIASTLNLRSDTSFFAVTLPASRLLAVSGGAQSAVVNTALAQPVVLRVTASDSVPVAGVAVTFAVTTGGGALAVLSDTSDANGLVSTSWTLGATVGAQSITATATGIAGATQVVTATGLAPVPTQLVFTAAPTTAIAGATLSTITVEARDADGVLTSLFTGDVTLALDSTATVPLSGTTTVAAVAGVATFANVSTSVVTAGVTLVATSAGLTSDTSAAFAVNAAAPASIAVISGNAQTGTLGQPLADSITVEVRDAFSNRVVGATVTFATISAGASISPTSVLTDANGQAKARWVLGPFAGAQSARADVAGGLTATLTATGVAGAAARLQLFGQPLSLQTAGVPIADPIVFHVIDAVGATVTTFSDSITIVLAESPAGPTTPIGTLTAVAVNGLVTFDNVAITRAGTGYRFTASSGSLPADTTSGITVLTGAAAQLSLVSGDAQTGAVITALAAPFVVRVTDAFGNGVAGRTVTWAITSTGGALSAATSTTDASGLASTTLTLPSVAGTATVQATAAGLAGSPQLFTATASAGAASQLAFTLNTGAGIAGAPITPGFVIGAHDALGNLVPTFTGAITVALTNGPPTAVLGGTATVNAVAGVATFADLTVDLASSSWVLAATSPGLTGASSAAFSIGAAAPSQIAVLSGDAQTASVLAALTDSIAFVVTDAFGNPAAGAPVTVAITVGDGSVSPVGGVTDAAGRFATAWTLGTTLGAQSITATITTAPTAQAVATATATPGAAVALALVNTIGSQVAGDTIPDLVVEARDAIGNVATGFNGVVNGRVLTGPNGPDTDSVSVIAVNGVATFSGQTFETAGDYTLRFNAIGLTDVIHPTITVTPGAAARIDLQSGAGQNGVAGLTLPAPVMVRTGDAFFNGVAGVTVDWVMVRGVDTLGVTTTVSNVNGDGEWQPTLSVTTGPVEIIARAAGLLNSPISVFVDVLADVTTQLAIATQPVAASAGVSMPASIVRAVDQYSNASLVFTGNVTAVIDSGPAGAVLSGTTTVAAVGGDATFVGLSLDLAGTYRLRYTSAGLTDAVSDPFVVSAGAATQLAVTQQAASGTAGAALAPSLVIEARDASGNLATGFTGAVTVALSGGDANAVLGGTVTVNAALGVASFNDLTIDLVGTTYVLNATAAGVTGASSGTIAVAPAGATAITVAAGDAQTGIVSATLTDSIAFRVTDAFGNRVPGTTVGIAVTTGGGTLAPTTGTTDAAGELRTAWTLGAPLGAQSITATVAAAPAVQVVATATAVAGAAAQLAITSAPLGTQVAGVAFPDVVVEARDANGNLATGFNGIVGAYVLDTASVPFDSAAATAVGGVATFTGAFLEAAGTYSLRFTAPGLTDALGSAFVVTPAAAAILGPDGANSGDGQTAAILTTLANPLRALLTDTYLNPIAGVTVLFTATRGIDTLTVDTVVTSAQGIASITPTMPETAGPIQYLVSTAGLTGFTLNVTADVGAAANLTLGASPTGGSVDAPIGTTDVTARDMGGNAVLAFTGNVTVSVDSGPAGAVLSGTLTQAAVAGVATFADLRLDLVGDYRLRFTSAGLNDEITAIFTMTVGAPAALAVVEGDGQTGAATQALPDSIGARVADQFGNPIAGATVVWTVQAGGGALAVASGSTDAAGIARNAWTLGANIGTQSVSADAAGLTQVLFTATATVTEANVVWTGATSAAWSVATNWSGGVVPSATDSVRVPAGTPFAPALDTQASVVGRLLVQNGATLVLDTFPLFVAGTLDVEAGAAVLSDSIGGFALIGTGTVRGAMPQLFVQSGAYALNGALSLTRDLAITGGSLAIGTFAANVGGNLSTIGTGQLVMTAAPGTLAVEGDAIFNGGSTAGLLTAGILSVRGDFVQAGGAADAFSASGTHVVELNGTVMQTVTLLNADAGFTPTCGAGSCFATLRSLKGAGEGAIEFGSDAKATTLMQFTGDSVYAPGQTLVSAGTPDFQTAVTVAGAIGWQVALTRGATFQVDTLVAWGTSAALIAGETIPTRVLGEYQLLAAHPGAIIVEGATGVLDVAGAVSVGTNSGTALSTRANGRLRMSQAGDTLVVLGDAEFGGGSTAGELTAGLLELHGAFTQSGVAESFAASGAHQTWFRGTIAQSVTFSAPGTGAGSSHFAALGVGQPTVGVAVQLNTATFVDGMLLTEPALSRRISSPTAQLITSQGATATGLVFERARWALVDGGPVTAIDSVTFEVQDAGLVQFEIVRSGGTLALDVPTFSTSPTTGRYLRVEDVDGPTANGALTVDVTVPSPATPGGFLEVVNGAVVNGWLDVPEFTWTGGASSNLWGVPSNWSGNAVPGPADSVFVPGGLAFNPIIPDAITLRAFVSARTESPIGLAGSLTITERLHVPTVGGISCTSGSLEFTNAVTPMTVSGRVTCFVRVLDGTLTATDTLDVGPNDIQVEGTAILDAGADLIAVGGQFSTLSGAQLRMQDDSAHVRLANSGNFGGGSTAGLLTAGRLEIGGNFTQNGSGESFSASGTHVTAFTGSVTQGVQFASPGANAGFSHFAHLEIGQPAGVTSVLLATDAFAIGQLRAGVDPQRFINASTPMTLTSHGAAVDGFAFDNVRWQLRDGAPVDLLTNTSFSSMDATVSQFDVERASGTVTAANVTFGTVPTTGAYVRVADVDGATGGNFTLSMSGTTPSFHGGAVQVIAPAVLDGWAANPGFIWTGATNSDWLTAANWSDGVVPTGADSVHIPTGLATYPVIAADTAMRVLTMDAGATLDHSGANVTVRGSVDMAPTASVTASSGRVVLAGAGAHTLRGAFQSFWVDGGDYALSGDVTTTAGIEVYNGDLSIGNFNLTVGGGILTGIGSTFTMTGTGTVDVATYVNFFGNSTAGRLTNGILRVRGDFEQLSGGGQEDLSFSASGNHVVELAGVGRQRVRFDSPDTTINGSCATSCFATLRSVQAPGTGWVEFSNGVKVLGDLDLQADSVVALGGVPLAGARLVVAGTARFDTPVLRAGLIAWQDSVAQNASVALTVDSLVAWGSDTLLVGMPGVPTVVTGSYRLRGTLQGSVDVQGALAIQGATRVIGDFGTSGSGTITLSQPGDTLAVDSTATFGGGSTAGLLTDGAVRVGGNFFTTASAAYAASGTHGTVLFSGCGLCDGYFLGLSDSLSTFRDLVIESGNWTVNPPSAEVHIFSNLSLLGSAQLDGTPLVRVGNNVSGDLNTALSNIRLSVAGAFDFAGTYLVDTLILTGASHVLTALDPLGNARNYNNVRVTGTATVVDDAVSGAQVLARLIVDGGTLRVGTTLSTDSARVFVNGVFETINGGVLEMQTPLGWLGTGNANFAGGSTAGLITAGTLAINGGDFTQAGNPESFVASGTHETRFSNEGAQQVTFANPGMSAGSSRFQHLRIQQTEGSGLELLSDVVAAGQLRESMSFPAIVTAPLAAPRALTTGGASVVGLEFDYVRWVLGDGAPVDSTVAIRFNNMPADVTQFDIIRGGGTVALETLDFLTPPSTGLYLRAEDGDVGNGDQLVVAVTFPTPTSHGGAIAEFGGAAITGWPQDPPLQGIVWSGAIDTQWSNIGNWDLGRLPIATDSVYIDGSVLSGAGNPYQVDINVSTTVAKLIIGPSASLTLNHTLGQTLQIDSLSSIPSNVTFNITSSSTLTGAGDVNMGGFLNWNGGTLAGTGAMIVQPGGTADVASAAAVTLSGRPFRVGGTATLGAATLNAVGTPTIEVEASGTLELAATKSFLAGNGQVNLVNAGTLRKAATAGLVRMDWPVTNTGTLEVVDDTLDLRNTLANNGGSVSIQGGAALISIGNTTTSAAAAFTVGTGGRLQLGSGGISADQGNHIFSAGSSITGLGWLQILSADTVRIQGAMDIDSLSVQNGETWFESASDTMYVNDAIYVGGGFFRGTGVIGVRGTFSTTGGNLNGTGTFAVLPAATLTLPLTVRGWNFDIANTGTIVWGDYNSSFEAEPVALTRPVMTIRSGGLFEIQHGATNRDIFGLGSETPPFDLISVEAGGTVRKTAGTAISNLRQRVLVQGLFEAVTGSINVQGTCSATGGATAIGAITGNCVFP